jgi:hypothetical protein
MTVSSALSDTIKALEKAPLIAGITTGVEDRLISVPDAVAEPVAAQILPEVLCRVQLRRVGWKWQEHDVVRTFAQLVNRTKLFPRETFWYDSRPKS